MGLKLALVLPTLCCASLLCGCSQSEDNVITISELPSVQPITIQPSESEQSSNTSDDIQSESISLDFDDVTDINNIHDCSTSPQKEQLISLLQKIEQDSPSAMERSPDASWNDIVFPYLNGEIESMKWVTMFALGGRIDPCSIELRDDGRFTTHIIVDSQVVAKVGGYFVGSYIAPKAYYETEFGERYVESKEDIMENWPT